MLGRIVKNTISNYALKGVQMLLNLIAIPVLVNSVGEEAFGIILFASVVVGYFNILEFGFSDGVTRYVAKYRGAKEFGKLSDIINTSLTFFTGIGFSVCILLIGLIHLDILGMLDMDQVFINQYELVFIFAAALAILAWPQMLFKSVLKGLEEFPIMNFTLGLTRILAVGGSILIVLFFEIRLEYLFLLFNIDKVILFFWQWDIIRKKLPEWKVQFLKFDTSIFKLIFSFSFWVFLGQLATMLEYQADQLVIISFVSPAAITTYTVVFYLFRVIQQFSGLAASAVMPRISAMEFKDTGEIKSLIFKAARYHLMVYVPISVLLYFMAEPFVVLWMGISYLKYLVLIKFSIAFQLLWQSSAVLGQIYLGLGYSKKLGISAILIGVSNLICSLVLVQFLGLSGVLWATIIVGAFSVPIVINWILKDIKIGFKEYFIRLILITEFRLCLFAILPAVTFFYFDLVIDTWIKFCICFGTLAILYATYLYLFVLTKVERSFCLNYFNQLKTMIT